MEHKEFYLALENLNIITPIWNHEIEFISSEFDSANKEEILSLFLIYFSLINDGNLFMSLDKETLKKKWNKKLEETRIRLKEKPDFDESSVDALKSTSNDLIENHLSDINPSNINAILGSNKIFIIEDNKLYLRIYYNSRLGIINSVKRLFKDYKESTEEVKFDNCTINLSAGQRAVVQKGKNNNVIVTGGPGTGKTTSILFLLTNLLEDDINREIYITAPSGKAASRMKESINKNVAGNLKEEYRNTHKEIIDKICNLEGKTIHTLLGYKGSEFKYNKNNQFQPNSIFIIDEASMIDVVIFDALLAAIPDGARVFILGDKDQLPSVGCGAIFGDLLESLEKFKVEIKESQRFKGGSPIDVLAKQINSGVAPKDITWQSYDKFEIMPNDKDKDGNKDYKIAYYLDNEKDDKVIISKIINIWTEQYYKKLKDECFDFVSLGEGNILEGEDYKILDKVFDNVEISKILCAENESLRGVKRINKLIDKLCYDGSDPASEAKSGFHAGEILMINQNDYALDLYNGDMGIVVKFEGDDEYYFMVKKTYKNPLSDGKRTNKIFKIKDYLFYPIHLISHDEIDLAFAITIHKSQGSDYNNILVILPKEKGHPLLNRQIVYTAITRTKWNTYILSNQERLKESAKTLLTRDSNIVI